ncbi:hypothetical protein LLG10_06305 [bacterium]|nr:hypothetical protein [bacterium]
MSIVYLRKKETGITYVYENQAFWDKTKQQSRSKRKLLGKLDPQTKEIIPTRPYRKHDRSSVQPMIPQPGPVPITQIRRSFYGASYLFDQIGKLTGVEADLKACFPDTYQKILSISYFLIMEDLCRVHCPDLSVLCQTEDAGGKTV